MEKNQLTKRISRFSLFAWMGMLLSVFAFVSCAPGGGGNSSSNNSSPSSAPPSVSDNGDPVITLGLGGSRTSRIMASYLDIKKITVTVRDNATDATNQGQSPYTLSQANPGGPWTGSLSGLQVNVAYNFYVTADNATTGGTTIFTGSKLGLVLQSGNNNLSLTMMPVGNQQTVTIPKIARITRPEYMSPSQSAPIEVIVQGTGLSHTFTVTGGGSYGTGASGTPTGNPLTASATYTAPNAVGNTAHTVKITNTLGNSIASTYTININNNARGTSSIVFGPSITGLHAKTLNNGNIEWTADVLTDNASATRLWSVTGGPTFLSGTTTNVATMNKTTSGGIITFKVSSGNDNATITYNMSAYQFPQQLIFGINPFIQRYSPSENGTVSKPLGVNGGFGDNITMHFSHKMSNIGVGNFTLSELKADNQSVAYDNLSLSITQFFDNGTNTSVGNASLAGAYVVKMDPNQNLLPGVYEVVISQAVVNLYNEPLSLDNRTWRFTVDNISNITWPAPFTEILGTTTADALDNQTNPNGKNTILLSVTGGNLSLSLAKHDIVLLSSGFIGIVDNATNAVTTNSVLLSNLGPMGDGTKQFIAKRAWRNLTAASSVSVASDNTTITTVGTTFLGTDNVTPGMLLRLDNDSQFTGIVTSVLTNTSLKVDNGSIDNVTHTLIQVADVGMKLVDNGTAAITVANNATTITTTSTTNFPVVGDRLYLLGMSQNSQGNNMAIVTATNIGAKTITVDSPVGDGSSVYIGVVKRLY